MSAYVPEFSYGQIGRDQYGEPQYGLAPWPEHLTPRQVSSQPAEPQSIALTKKGEAYVAAALAEAGGVFLLTLDPKDRTSISASIERLIALLDAMDVDPDLEDDREQDEADSEPTLGAPEHFEPCSQIGWAAGGSDDREDENEHGGDILDVPHDDEGDAEPSLGRLETVNQGRNSYRGKGDDEPAACLSFNGDGYLAGRKVLRNLWCKRPDRPQEWPSYSPGIGDSTALDVDGLTIKGRSSSRPERQP